MKNAIIIITAFLILIMSASKSQGQESSGVPRSHGRGFYMGPGGIKLTKARNWLHTNPSWAATGSYYALTRIDSDDYVYTIPNLRAFYGTGKDTSISSIIIVFKDSLGTVHTNTMYIKVFSPEYARSKYAGEYKQINEPAITTNPYMIVDSTESATIHFHPYRDKHRGKKGNQSLRDFKGTVFIYTGFTRGVDMNAHDKAASEGDFERHFGILDLGVNMIKDNTNYNSPTVKNFLGVPANRQNSSLFKLRQGKSINVNIYPFMETLYAVKRKNQKINISMGIGLQLYNFRYESPISYRRSPNTVALDSVSFKKNKLSFDYLNIPLMITFKTRLHKDKWLVYGVGITGGYSIATWTKQESGAYGKVKVHDNFGFSNFNSCITGEIGITNIFRLYGTYQLTNMFDASTGMDQHPISFGIRFFGI